MRPFIGPQDHVIRLPDGRHLGYAEYGDPAGWPLLNCHGGLTGRLDVESADGAARQVGVRIVSPDRPGIGLSDRQPGRTIGQWPADAAVLADHLGLEAFSVMGWSFGGPYAAAVAALLPERARSAALVAGGVPLSWPCAAKGFENRTDALLFRLSTRAPGLARAGLGLMGQVAARAPELWVRLGGRQMAPPDLVAIRRDGARQFARSIAAGLRPPSGAVDDYRAYGAPWGFDYESIRIPVHMWQGQVDTFLPQSWSEEAAHRIPGASLTVVPDRGHFVARDHWNDIFEDLVARASGSGPGPTDD